MKIKLDYPFDMEWKHGYLRVDKKTGRKRLDLYNSPSDRSTISYARYLKCVDLGYILTEDYEVDHRDNNCTNDDLDNLNVLTKEEHLKRLVKN